MKNIFIHNEGQGEGDADRWAVWGSPGTGHDMTRIAGDFATTDEAAERGARWQQDEAPDVEDRHLPLKWWE
jgi:hypothetical protein